MIRTKLVFIEHSITGVIQKTVAGRQASFTHHCTYRSTPQMKQEPCGSTDIPYLPKLATAKSGALQLHADSCDAGQRVTERSAPSPCSQFIIGQTL